MSGLLILICVGLAWGFGVKRYADRRGYNTTKAFWLGFLFGPFALVGYWISATNQHRYV